MQILIAKTFVRSACLILLLGTLAGQVAAQSTDVAAPSAIRSNEVEGTIPARDIGDARVTDHYYAFTGMPGDVLITVDSRNLNGDVDVFTFSGLQPLLKFTVYAGSTSPITKSIFLRRQQDLILRVEGRTPNDDEAVYRIRFGGSFAPITSTPWLADSDNAVQPTTADRPVKKGRRVTSAGARIYEPPAEVAEAPTPEPTPDATPDATPAESVEAPKTAAAKPKPRNSRVRRPVTRRKQPTATAKAEESAAAKDENEAKTATENAETEPKAPAPRRRPTRRSATARAVKPAPAPAPPQELEESGPRLLIETNDGTLIDRFMSSVRRVTVENGQVVVVGRDGKIQRVSLASVVRMTIAP